MAQSEASVIAFLFAQAGLTYDIEKLLVEPMMDGGMGSLRFLSETATAEQVLGRQAAECFFHNSDGVLAIAALNLDQNDELFELDVWKVDFSPLIAWPEFTRIHKTPEIEAE